MSACLFAGVYLSQGEGQPEGPVDLGGRYSETLVKKNHSTDTAPIEQHHSTTTASPLSLLQH